MKYSLPLFLILAACGAKAPGIPTPPPAAPALAAFVLAADPGEALDVVAAKLGGPAAKVTVQGRLAEITRGVAAFRLVDFELPYCGEKAKEDTCKTPWDYCCEDSKTIVANTMVVELRDAAGKPIASPSLPDLRLLDAVKVTGELVKDEMGNFTLLAKGYFRSARPQLPDGLNWPQ